MRRFAMLAERYKERRKQEDRRAGEIIAILYNANRAENAEGIDWRDVFPEWKEETEQSEESMLEIMTLWATTTKALPS